MRRAAWGGGGGGSVTFRRRAMEGLAAALLLYALVVLALESPLVLSPLPGGAIVARKLHLSDAGAVARPAPARPDKESRPAGQSRDRDRLSRFATGLDLRLLDTARSGPLRGQVANAVAAGARVFAELEGLDAANDTATATALAAPSAGEAEGARCPQSIAVSAEELRARGRVVELPCGLALGSHVTVAATPRAPHEERDPAIAVIRDGDAPAVVSQFMVELQGLRAVDGEDPPRVLHFNPRLRGDWSGRPVIEQNTCYRMNWGTAHRCEGWRSRPDEETGWGPLSVHRFSII